MAHHEIIIANIGVVPFSVLLSKQSLRFSGFSARDSRLVVRVIIIGTSDQFFDSLVHLCKTEMDDNV